MFLNNTRMHYLQTPNKEKTWFCFKKEKYRKLNRQKNKWKPCRETIASYAINIKIIWIMKENNDAKLYNSMKFIINNKSSNTYAFFGKRSPLECTFTYLI